MASRGKGFGLPRQQENLLGMVKSYNRKGFGFIMCQSLDADVYFSKESLAPQLQTSDIAGEYVKFDYTRFPDGRLQARNLRAVGEPSITRGPDGFGGVTTQGRGKGCIGKGLVPPSMMPVGIGQDEDRSKDWYCSGCGERNFVKRFECHKCKLCRPHGDGGVMPSFAPPVAPRRTLSPHAGSRAMREMFRNKGAGKGGAEPAGSGKRDSSSSGSRGRRRKRSESRSKAKSKSSSSSDSSSDRKRKKKKKRRRKSDSSSSASSSKSKQDDQAASSSGAPGQETAPVNPEVEKAKAEVLEKLLQLKKIEPKEARIKAWRALLREWHPDKNPDRMEVATAVFQFLQKGKALIDAN